MSTIKNQTAILVKLGIKELNPMQEEALSVIQSHNHTILLSPTGTGKTLAFLLPMIADLDASCNEVQALIVVPTRELAVQIAQVTQNMGTGFRNFAVYGGQSFSNDKIKTKI